jgi:D-alanine-D-alanine ligase-like ATP-grasp enzyme
MDRETYPEQTANIRRACASLGLEFADLDEGRGYLFSISDRRTRLVSGTGSVCAYPLNSAPAFAVSRDKAHTKSALSQCGIATIPGKLFFLSKLYAQFRPPGRELEDARALFSSLETPRFCKPNLGSRGDFAEVVTGTEGFENYLARVRQRYDAILVEPVLAGDEYRVFCLDGEVIFATLKAEFLLKGDGVSTIAALVTAKNRELEGHAVSPIDLESFSKQLMAMHKLAPGHVLAAGQSLAMPARRNLSAAGDVQGLILDVPQPLADLAKRAAAAISLRVSGVDIFDISPNRDLSKLVVIEINGNPSIATLDRLGRRDLVDRIWQTVLETYFRERDVQRTLR